MSRDNVKRRAEKARQRVNKMIVEQTQWQGKRPTVIRVQLRDYLALVELEWADRWPGIEVKPG